VGVGAGAADKGCAQTTPAGRRFRQHGATGSLAGTRVRLEHHALQAVARLVGSPVVEASASRRRTADPRRRRRTLHAGAAFADLMADRPRRTAAPSAAALGACVGLAALDAGLASRGLHAGLRGRAGGGGVIRARAAGQRHRGYDDEEGGRVAPGRRLPGAPTDPDVQVSRIRLFVTQHSLRGARDGWRQQRVALQQPHHRLPGEATLRAAAQPPVPLSRDPLKQRPETRPIALPPVVGVVAP